MHKSHTLQIIYSSLHYDSFNPRFTIFTHVSRQCRGRQLNEWMKLCQPSDLNASLLFCSCICICIACPLLLPSPMPYREGRKRLLRWLPFWRPCFPPTCVVVYMRERERFHWVARDIVLFAWKSCSVRVHVRSVADTGCHRIFMQSI